MLDLVRHIREAMPELSLVDEYYGQLELATAEESYPVTFPCAFVDVKEVQWESRASGLQHGNVAITVRLAIDCYYGVTSDADPDNVMQARLQLAGLLHRQLSDYVPDGALSGLERTRTAMVAIFGGKKVYEHTYTCLVEEDETEE